MKRAILSFLVLIIVISLLAGCQSKQSEPYIYFKDEEGKTILTDHDLNSMKVISLLDTGKRGFYIEFINGRKLEEITKENLNKKIQIYNKDELISSSRIEYVIKGKNLVFNDMKEETLKRIEMILQKNK